MTTYDSDGCLTACHELNPGIVVAKFHPLHTPN